MSESDQWYYASGEQRFGPVPAQTLQDMAAAGQLHRGVLVWREGMAQWSPAGDQPELFPQSTPAAAMPQPVGTLPYQGGGMPAQHHGALDYFRGIGVSYGGFWRRFAAYLLDTLIIYAPLIIIQLILQQVFMTSTTVTTGTTGPGGTMTQTNTTGSIVAVSGCGMSIVQILAFWLYFALQESSSLQATLGKRLLGLYVADEQGNRISFGRASGRLFGKFLSGMILYIGFIMAAFTQRRQALHDMMAGTVVLKREPSTAQPAGGYVAG
jgi:uncharacterized RDD family membrane protein YckC